jgi:hypothetical protein
MPVVLGMMVQGMGITAKWSAGFCFRAVHQRGMAATGAMSVWVQERTLSEARPMSAKGGAPDDRLTFSSPRAYSLRFNPR